MVMDTLQHGVAQGGSTTTIRLALHDTQPDNFYNGMRITVTSGTGSGQTAYIGAILQQLKLLRCLKKMAQQVLMYSIQQVLQLLLTQQQITKLNQELPSSGGSPTRNALRVEIENQKIKDSNT